MIDRRGRLLLVMEAARLRTNLHPLPALRTWLDSWRGIGDVERGMERQGFDLVDETGEWKVASRPYVTNGGKDAHVRVKKAGQPEVTEIRSWGAHERIGVRRG